MKLTLKRTKMAMDGNFFSYDVLVPITEVDANKFNYYTIWENHTYVSFDDATRPEFLDKMERGEERYQAYMAHAKRAKYHAWMILRAHFPEIEKVKESELWVEIPGFTGSHATVEANWSLAGI